MDEEISGYTHAGFASDQLVRCSSSGDTTKMRVLLLAGVTPNSENVRRGTALMAACMAGHEDAVRLLLAAGAVVDLTSSRARDTPLMTAGAHGQTRALRALLEAGAAVNLKDNIGRTALMCAIDSGKVSAMRVLLEAGAELPTSVPRHPDDKKMQQLLAYHRQARAWVQARADMEWAAVASGDALLAEEEAEKLSSEARQASARRKKQRQNNKRAVAVTGPAREEERARSGQAPSGTPSQYSSSQSAGAASPVLAGIADGQMAGAEENPEEAEDGVSVGASRRVPQVSDSADERGGMEGGGGCGCGGAPRPSASRDRPR